MRVETFLKRSAAATLGKSAVVAGEERLSYADFDDRSSRLASVLLARGVQRGDRVVVFMENVLEAAIAIFAVLKAGCTFCPVNPAQKADGLGFVLTDCRPRAVLTQTKFLGVCGAACQDLPDLPLVIAAGPTGALPDGILSFDDCLAEAAMPLPDAGSDGELAMIIYTSGSTGRPKGVMMTHASMDAASGAIAGYLDNTQRDVVLCALPLSFTYGLYQLLVAVRVGATLVLERNFAFPHAVLDKARAEGVTGLPLVPTIAAMLLAMKDVEPLPGLRYITNAAAPLPPAHIEGLRALFPGVKFYSMYGLTECARATFLPPEELDGRPGSVGKAIPGTEVIVLDEVGQPAGSEVVGELVVRGPHLMRGYWENPEATDAVLRPGPIPGERQLHTGDLFRTDADGFLYFVGRKDDMLKIRGEKVAPRQVEAVLCDCPGVAEAVVVGRPNPILGLVLHALIVATEPVPTEREILRHCARVLPDFMVPKTIEFRVELPKTASGKVARRLAAQREEQS
ncbi:class I adenylate-forming enzyme family protein [Mesorhizobium sp. ANAO-SY3R2]|uniref:class I adenylate-forming enzyme family protein n=1 Tax=Mesorhizobium sp. ANAO-SY3R2 TaxID=3166644 RepID=UPI00366FDD4F